jgi:predicted Zn-dependent peptidase
MQTSRLANGLLVHRIPVGGTRAVTVLIAFEAGSRTERAEENGIAHFVEHLVFKGGEKYPNHREVNVTAERMGARLAAYTSQDIVAFGITARAEVATEAIDLLTDFVARPRIEAEELERERGVVIQEIARADDQPAEVANRLIDQAAFGEHPLGRPILGTEGRLRAFDRDVAFRFRARAWSGERGGVFIVGNLSALPPDDELEALFARFSSVAPGEAFEPAPSPVMQVLVSERDSNQSHLRLLYRPGVDVSDPRARAALTIYKTMLGGSTASILFDEVREQRGLAYSAYAQEHSYSDFAVLQLSAGLDSSKCVETYELMRKLVDDLRERGPAPEHVERARAYAAGRRVLAFESTTAVAERLAEESLLHGTLPAPDEAVAALDAVTYQDVAEVARAIPDSPAVACVGPHRSAEFG